MPGPFAQRVAGRSGRATRYLLDLNLEDGLNDDGVIQARSGALLSFSRGGTVGSAYTRDRNGIYVPLGSQQPAIGSLYDTGAGALVGGLLSQVSRQNAAFGSNLLADTTYWGWNVAPTLAAAKSCILGQVAQKHTDTAGGSHYRSQTVGTFVNAQADCSWAIVENVDATEAMLGIFDGTAGAFLAATKMTWSTLTCVNDQGTVPTASGAVDLGIGPNGGQMVLLYVTGTGTAAGTGQAGRNRVVLFYYSGVPSNTKSVIVHHLEVNPNATHPSASPIVTVAAAVTRSTDVATIAFNYAPTDFTAHVRMVLPCTSHNKYANVYNIGDNNDAAAAELYCLNAAVIGEIRGTPNTPTAAQGITPARTADITVQYRNWKTGPSCALDVGAGFGAWSAASDAKTGFANPVVRLNGGSNGSGIFLLRAVRIADGLRTRNYMMAA